MEDERAIIGVDVGGTHTDVAVLLDDRIERGKALTTYDEFSRGVLDAIAVAAAGFDLSPEQLLAKTQLVINGTTVVTNTITELRGGRVGVLITRGFEDTFRFSGGPRTAEFDDHRQVNVPDLVPRDALAGIDERIDWAGEVLVPIELDQVRERTRRLVEDVGIDSLAICFLSSYVNGAHEAAAARAVREAHPDLFVTVSHEVFPVAGETRRFTTAVLNSFVQERAEAYLFSLEQRLREAGLAGSIAFFQGLGGGISLERAKQFPLALLGSGPAAGAMGANELAKRMGESRVLLGDMGGTSFDTGIIVDNSIHIEKNIDIGPFATGVNLVDVVSVGAGGGSIAEVSERGVPQVGPRSAGSDPGPAAYGRGGSEATVTDALVALGMIDPDRYLGGRVKLRREPAAEAIRRSLADEFGWSVERAAVAIHDLVVVNMANAVREVSVGKGHDPREFLFLAYGGTLPLFAAQIADRLHIPSVVIPQNSSVFCALGLLAADFVVRLDHAVGWDLGHPEDVGRVNDLSDRLDRSAREAIAAEGFADGDIAVARTADFRFQGQQYELTMEVPSRSLAAEDAESLARGFLAKYESTYGEGTAWKGVSTTMVNYSVTATGRKRHEWPSVDGAVERAAAPEPREAREAFLPGEEEWRSIPVFADTSLVPGTAVAGPLIVDATDTTIFVPPGRSIRRDGHLNFVLDRSADA
jgi:N-methylhydantoinase A